MLILNTFILEQQFPLQMSISKLSEPKKTPKEYMEKKMSTDCEKSRV